jgi:hypothetical protein
MEEKLTTLEKYGYIYHMVGMNPITRKELREKIKKDSPKMSETTLKKYSDAPFDGAYPMFVVKEDKATLDITAFRSFIEELCKYVGTDAAVLFTGPAPAPGGRKGDNPQIAKVPNKAENPQILNERKKNTELSKQIAELEKQIEELRLENQKIVADSVLANMSKEINISTVRVFGKAVEEDIFLHNVSDILGEVRDVSKVGGIRQSFYVNDSDKTKELTVQNARSKVAEILFRSKFFEKLFHDSCAYEKKVSGKVDITATQMDANRRKSIELLLSDDKLSNRAKLALYAGWHEYHGTEMEDLLNYAGDHCLDANYVIRLLEKPDVANNYQNIRGFLRQACKASEARMKREAAKELIAGEWFVIAEYNGKPCRFQMFPVEELLYFEKLLRKGLYPKAVLEIDKLLGTYKKSAFVDADPEKELVVRSAGYMDLDAEYYAEASKMIHQYEEMSGIDANVPIEEDGSSDDFKEYEEGSHGE